MRFWWRLFGSRERLSRSVTLPEGQWRCVGLGETEGDVLNGGRDVVLGENDGIGCFEKRVGEKGRLAGCFFRTER